MNTCTPRKCSIAPTEHSQKFTAQRHKTPCHQMIPLSLMKNKTKLVQQIIGGVLYYGRAVDLTVIPALISIESEQASATENTDKKCTKLLYYLATHDNARIRYHASDMVLNIHSDASYLSETIARIRVAGKFFLGSKSDPTEPIVLNGTLYIMCRILKFVVASVAEAELGALFLNCKEGIIMRLTLQEMGHPQPSTPIHRDNMTATGIENETIKKQCS